MDAGLDIVSTREDLMARSTGAAQTASPAMVAIKPTKTEEIRRIGRHTITHLMKKKDSVANSMHTTGEKSRT